eukprot:TRINITY_DN38010_c1_g1_i10.p1 TRINITY_DN38010_c1_g1~~TRINITY_DN38010_c1_g1_i10.p1  ORF type:complete len:138 (-),score=28.09 TRINITY_DN38010_c1_g1_i10:38-451(-)
MLRYLQLPPLQERGRQLRFTMMYKIAGGMVPAIPPRGFSHTSRQEQASNNKSNKVCRTRDESNQNIIQRQAKYAGYETQNIIQRQAVNNSRGFKIPATKTEQYRGSFFIRHHWNGTYSVKMSSCSSLSALSHQQLAD